MICVYSKLGHKCILYTKVPREWPKSVVQFIAPSAARGRRAPGSWWCRRRWTPRCGSPCRTPSGSPRQPWSGWVMGVPLNKGILTEIRSICSSLRLWGHHIFFGGSVSDGVVTCPIFSLGKMRLSINHARLYFFLTTLAHSPRLTIKCWIRGRFCTPKQPRPLLLVALCQWH